MDIVLVTKLNTCKEIKSQSHHMRYISVSASRTPCMWLQASCLVLNEETEKQKKGFNSVTKLHIKCAMLNFGIFYAEHDKSAI